MTEKREYTPSPWLKEDLTVAQVRVPPAVVAALYRLQQDKQEVEYGGAIDFELVVGKPAVERILTYTGTRGAISGETWDKVFANPDIELTFHTHPKQAVAVPSEGDIIFFLTTPQRAMLIFAGKEALLLTKGTETPPDEYFRQHMDELTRPTARAATPKDYNPQTVRSEQQETIAQLRSELGIDSVVYPVKEPIDLTLKIVQDVAREGRRLEMFR